VDITGKEIGITLNQNQLDVEYLPEGLYFLEILHPPSGKTFIKKFVKSGYYK
jgi:hypothetical protein